MLPLILFVFNLVHFFLGGKMSIAVTLYVDKDVPSQTLARSKGFEQTIKWLGLSNGEGWDGGDVFCYRYLKPSEVKSNSTKNIHKLVLPWVGGAKCHFWLIKKNMDMVDFHYEMIDKFLFPHLMKMRAQVCSLEPGDEIDAKLHRMLWTFDGEYTVMTALIKFMKTPKFKAAKIMAAKFSPATSGCLSGNPMDHASSFKNAKAGHAAWSQSSHMARALEKIVYNDDEIVGE